MDAVAGKHYAAAQKQSLLHNLELQTQPLSELNIARVPGFKSVFDARLEEKLGELARQDPAKVATPEMRTAQRDNLRKELLGTEGKALHDDYLDNSEHADVIGPVKTQLAINTWRSAVDETIKKLQAEK
jgi:hypothetical protein